MISNLAIVGGGTAGLVTALVVRQAYPHLDITLLKSDKIGIVGVGEGTTEHWADMMQYCNIEVSDLVKETDATFKYGINFVNWQGDNQGYLQSVSGEYTNEDPLRNKFTLQYLIANGAGPNDLVPSHVLNSLHKRPYNGINQFHFNTHKLNEYFLKLCEQRNINIQECEIESFEEHEHGIKKLIDINGKEYEYDLYVDSTGFNKLLIQKFLNRKWVSYSKYLPMNSAIAFPTERKENIESWTLARAMDSGWLWRIPTQNRYGNGYVFCDEFCDYEQAQQEVEDLYGHEINIGKRVKFEAGHIDTPWYKNVVTIGLSASFVEPLEASAIGSGIQQAFILKDYIQTYYPGSTICAEKFNTECISIFDNIRDFIRLHYITERNDTEFWKFVQTLPIPDSLQNILEVSKHSWINNTLLDNHRYMFKDANYILVMHGLGLIDPKVAERCYEMQSEFIKHNAPIQLEYVKKALDKEKTISHRQALDKVMKGEYEDELTFS